jgi:hypothetical protein
MRSVALAAVSLMLVTAVRAQETEKLEELRNPRQVTIPRKFTDKLTDPAIKVTASQLEKHLHLKVTKFFTVNADMVVILEFVKDAEDVSTLHDLLQEGPPMPPGAPGSQLPPQSSSTFCAYAFDEDNVVVAKSAVKAVSEITGKQGEAFKVILSGLGKAPNGSPIRKIDIRSQSPLESLIGPNLPGPGFNPSFGPGPAIRPGRPGRGFGAGPAGPRLVPPQGQIFDSKPDVGPLSPRPPVSDVPVVVPGPPTPPPSAAPIIDAPRLPAPGQPLNEPIGETR